MNRAGVKAVGGSQRTGVAAEQRRRPRMERLRELVIHPMQEGEIGEEVVVRTQDFSSLGLGLVVDEPMEVGEQFLVTLATRSGPAVPLLYSVVHCTPVEEGYKVGGELVSLLDLDEYAKRRMTRTTIAQYISDAVGEE